MNKFFKKWWNGLLYEPGDPRQLAGGRIKIAVLGGGTGLSTLLKGLKLYSTDISAVISVADDGSSSGLLRKEFDILPPGDIRKCISALALDEDLVSNIMEYRFAKQGSSLSGHTLGNVWITALTKYFGSFEQAIEATTEIFKTAGKVMPATLDNINLIAEYEDGDKCIGESELGKKGKKIRSIKIDKKKVRAYPKSQDAIRGADLIVIGPGSLYTSVVPNLLIGGIREAINSNSKAVKIYVANCSTERGETENYSVEDHIDALIKHSSGKLVDYCLVNSVILQKSAQESKLGEINNITTDKNEYREIKVVKDDLIDAKKPLYHDSAKLAKSIIMLYNKVKEK